MAITISISDPKPQYAKAIVSFVIAVLLQAAIGPNLHFLGAHADLLVALTATWALIRSAEEAMVAAVPAALLLGLLSPDSIGTPLLALATPIALSLVFRNDTTHPRLLLLELIVVCSSVAALVIEMTVDFIGGQRGAHFAGLGSVVAGEAILNCLLAAVAFAILRHGPRRQPARRARLSLS